MKISALILAAGEGKRVGIPKAILKIKDSYLADIQFELLKNSGIENIKIVIGARAEEVKQSLKNNFNLVVNSIYKEGQFSSLIAGIKSMDEFDGLLILPVDTYPLDQTVINRLISEFNTEMDAVVPIYRGKKGHPIIISKKFADSLLDYDISQSRLDFILRTANIKIIEVNSPTILNNINTLIDIP